MEIEIRNAMTGEIEHTETAKTLEQAQAICDHYYKARCGGRRRLTWEIADSEEDDLAAWAFGSMHDFYISRDESEAE